MRLCCGAPVACLVSGTCSRHWRNTRREQRVPVADFESDERVLFYCVTDCMHAAGMCPARYSVNKLETTRFNELVPTRFCSCSGNKKNTRREQRVPVADFESDERVLFYCVTDCMHAAGMCPARYSVNKLETTRFNELVPTRFCSCSGNKKAPDHPRIRGVGHPFMAWK